MLGADPDIVIVETGPNDALRGVDISVTAENIDAMAKALRNLIEDEDLRSKLRLERTRF